MHHMQPQVKTERIDPALLPPSYHLQQQQLQLQQQQLQLQQHHLRHMAPQANSARESLITGQHLASKPNASQNSHEDKQNVESLPDYSSIRGKFGWTTVDNVNIPYILRHEKQFVSVRIVEMKLLSRYPNSYPDDLGKHAPLTSFFITVNEAKLFNEINSHHCAGEYGRKEFTTKDLIVLLTDFTRFYELVKKTFPDPKSAREFAESNTAGWLQIKNTVTPYVSRTDGKYVPLSVIQYAAGLLTGQRISGLPPTAKECELLNDACKTAGVEFVFSETTRLIRATDILKVANVDIVELPNTNPLKHATYMELPTTSNAGLIEKTKVVSPAPQNGQRTTQPYRFQPTTQMEMFRTQLQDCVNNPDSTVGRHPAYVGPPMFDPRLPNLYRMPFSGPGQPPFLPPVQSNIRPPQFGPVPSNILTAINPMMQYYLGMQNNTPGQKTTQQGPPNRVAPPQSLPTAAIHGSEQSSRSPGANSSNPSPRSRPPSNSRPPSGSPLSPTSPSYIQGRSPGYVLNPENTPPLPNSQNYGGTSLQHMQNMYAQRFPGPLPATIVPANHPAKDSVPQENAGSNISLKSPEQSGSTLLPPNQNANQEIPGLFSPTGSNVVPQKPPPSVLKSPTTDIGAPPPLLLMSNPSLTNSQAPPTQTNELSNPEQVKPTMAVVVPASKVVPVTETRIPDPSPPKPVAVVKKPSQDDNVSKIKGAWLNNKSISCLHLDKKDSNGKYCLVEAVCKLYFNGCSVNEFLFALENVLNVPLLTCSDDEEKAFIQYYSLPVEVLKCNKMIKFDDLENFFPQLSYMFPDKSAQELSLEQDTVDFSVPDGNLEQDNNNVNKIIVCGTGQLTEADLEAVMPVSLAEMVQTREKRGGNGTEEEPSTKRTKISEGDGDFSDAVIILD